MHSRESIRIAIVVSLEIDWAISSTLINNKRIGNKFESKVFHINDEHALTRWSSSHIDGGMCFSNWNSFVSHYTCHKVNKNNSNLSVFNTIHPVYLGLCVAKKMVSMQCPLSASAQRNALNDRRQTNFFRMEQYTMRAETYAGASHTPTHIVRTGLWCPLRTFTLCVVCERPATMKWNKLRNKVGNINIR